MIDGPVPGDLLYQNLRELDFLNRNFGGHSASIDGLRDMITAKNRTYNIIDFGCGGGDTMIRIANWARNSNFRVKITGIDKNPQVIDYVRHKCKNYSEISAIAMDFREFIKGEPVADIMHCSLFLHHLPDEDIVKLLQYFNKAAETGFVVNDLIRSRVAYYSAKFFTALANASVISRNDGPLSVLRSFNINELRMFMKRASIRNYHLRLRWAFRFLITSHAESSN